MTPLWALVGVAAGAQDFQPVPVRFPHPADAPTAIVGTVKSWKPDINAGNWPTPKDREYMYCNTVYTFTVEHVIRGPAVVGGEWSVRWPGCKLEDGTLRSWVVDSPAPPPAGARLLVFLNAEGWVWGEDVFWADATGDVHLLNSARFDAKGSPVPMGDWVVRLARGPVLRPAPEHFVVGIEKFFAVTPATPMSLAAVGEVIRTGRYDETPSDP